MIRWLLAFALLGCASAQAQYAQQLGGSSSLVIGATPITGGATNCILFNNGGSAGCDSGATYAGSNGTVNIIGQVTTSTGFQAANGQYHGWANGTRIISSVSGSLKFQNNGDSQDFTITTGAANLATFNGVVAGTPGILSTGVAFASLPATTAGTIVYMTDGLAGNCGDGTCTTFGTNVTGGGGALKLLVWRNGTNWTLIGK